MPSLTSITLTTPYYAESFKVIIPDDTQSLSNATAKRDINRSSILGHTLWPSAYVLLLYLAENPVYCNQFDTIVELGSGLGVVGCFLFQMFRSTRIVLTDLYDDILAKCQQVCKLNNIPTSCHDPHPSRCIQILAFSWGGSLHSLLASDRSNQQLCEPPLHPRTKPNALILGSDLSYDVAGIEPLLTTIMLSGSPCILAYQHRDDEVRNLFFSTATDLRLTIDIIWDSHAGHMDVDYSGASRHSSQTASPTLHCLPRNCDMNSHVTIDGELFIFDEDIDIELWCINPREAP